VSRPVQPVPPRTAPAPLPARRESGWQTCWPELAIAAILMTGVTLAAYAWAGLTVAAMALAFGALLALAVLRTLPEAPPAAVQPDEWEETTQTSIAGFWRRRGVVRDATANMAAFEAELRPTLQHLLAARLSERHGISLYADPDAARRLLLPGGRDQQLWHWLDPERPPNLKESQAGIPPRTLAAIIQRLEQL
jgi:hypothetical protein